MFGLPNGVYYCNLERTNELNNRIFNRNLPSQPLKPEISFRPEQTKFTILGKDPMKKPETCSTKAYPKFNPSEVFNPGNATAPWYGYASNVNEESTLRNQFFALQSCDQAKYIPSSKSDLYNNSVEQMPQSEQQQPFPNLFRTEQFDNFEANKCGIAKQLFNNHTQQQIKDL